MYRTSSKEDFYKSGTVIIDADGIPFEPASKDYVDQRVPIDSLTGTGSPEGKIVAPVGAVYTDTVATTGAIRWIKTSGTGNTGWRVAYGETGRRDITSLTTATAGTFTLERSGSLVRISSPSSSFNMDNGARIATLPAGFRPPALIYMQTPPYWSSEVLRTVRIESNGAVIVRGGADSDVLNVSFTFSTSDQWPTSLPGTPL